MTKKFERKNKNCTSFYFILSGEQLKKVEDRQQQHYEKCGGKLSIVSAVNLLILGQ